MSEYDSIPTHVTEVVSVTRRSDSFVRVTFGGGLERFRAKGPDDFVYVLLPPPGRRVLPIDASFRWTEFYAMAEDERPVGAYYTVRHFRPDAGELDCDREPPSGWSTRCAPRTGRAPPPTPGASPRAGR